MALEDLSTVHIGSQTFVTDQVPDQLLPLARWRPIRGDALRIPEVTATPGTVSWVNATSAATADAATPTTRLAELKRVMGEFDLGEGYRQAYSGMLDQQKVQADVKRLLLRQAIGLALVRGSGASDEPSGLIAQSTNTTSGASAAMTLAMLRSLLQLILSNGGRCDYIVMSGQMLNKFRSLYDAALLPVPTLVDPQTGLRHAAYSGVPILRNDHLYAGAATDEWVLALNLDAFCLVYPEGIGDRGLVVNGMETRASGSSTMRLTQTVGVALLDQVGVAVLNQVRS